MKIEINTVKELLEQTMGRNVRPVQEEPLSADAMDKMFNFGVQAMFYDMVNELNKVERILVKEGLK